MIQSIRNIDSNGEKTYIAYVPVKFLKDLFKNKQWVDLQNYFRSSCSIKSKNPDAIFMTEVELNVGSMFLLDIQLEKELILSCDFEYMQYILSIPDEENFPVIFEKDF